MSLPNDRVLPVDFITADASFSRSVWHFQIPRKFSFEDCLNPEVWRHNNKLKANDLVDLVGEAGDFDCTCRVVSAERGFVIFRVLREFHADAEPARSELTGAHIALQPNQGWCLYAADGSPIARFGDEESAQKALDELVATQAPAADEASA